MIIKITDLEKGNKVWCGGSSGFCYDDIHTVEKTSFKYDENTGDKYKIIHLEGDRLFDSRTGFALTSPTAYHIEGCEQ